MNFALVITNLRGGGAEKTMIRLAAALTARAHRAALILLERRIEHDLPAGLELHALTETGVRLKKGLLGKLRAAWRLRALYADLDFGPDAVVVSTLPFADEVVAMARLPNTWFRIANTLSAEAEMLAQRDPRRAARRMKKYRRLYEGRNLIAVSAGVEADLRQRLGLCQARIVTIHGGYNVEALRLASMRMDPEVPDEPFILHVGRFMPQKRHDLLFEAYCRAQLPHRLVLLTRPSPELDAMIARYGLTYRVTVAGFRPNPYPWMRAADLLVLCSQREGMPNVLVEALACGTRVLSTDCPSGPREVLRGPLSRWLVPCDDAEALSAAMRRALAAPRPGPEALPPEFTEACMVQAYERLAAVARTA
jgi:glycosyltransferase involved in cell wall biosynthesis